MTDSLTGEGALGCVSKNRFLELSLCFQLCFLVHPVQLIDLCFKAKPEVKLRNFSLTVETNLKRSIDLPEIFLHLQNNLFSILVEMLSNIHGADYLREATSLSFPNCKEEII